GFRIEAVRPLLGRLIIDGFSFDVELLRALLDRNVRVVEVPVVFRYDSEPSTVRFIADSIEMLRDLIWIRMRSLRGAYRVDPPGLAPPDIAVRADDFGLSPGVNHAIQLGLESGSLTAASLMMGTPHSAEALAWAAQHPEARLGVHLNVTQGRPVCPPEEVASLVDRSGSFLGLGRFLARFATGRIRLEHVRREWRAQIDRVRAAGVALEHLYSPHHVPLLPGIWDRVAAPLADQEGVSLRTMDGPVHGEGWRPNLKGRALQLASRGAIRRRPRGKPRHGFGTSLTA